ncbi:MAG: formylglycine-generating enzyme family protein [Microcystaceae cyanobacterium]
MTHRLTLEFSVMTVNAQGQIERQEQRQNQADSLSLPEDIGLTLVMIPAGTLMMGAPVTEEGFKRSQGPQHRVDLPAFWMSQTAITQAQWEVVTLLPKVNLSLDPYPANFVGDNRPVEKISWYEAREFCDRLSQFTQQTYRLPREAEWEYACRAGTTTPFHFGPTLTTDLANYSGIDWDYQGKICNRGAYGQGPLGEDRRQTVEVGTLGGANAWGLQDCHGNVREWCADPWSPHYLPTLPGDSLALTETEASKRVVRGGSWNTGPHPCRSAYRDRLDPQARRYDVGFRVVRSAP